MRLSRQELRRLLLRQIANLLQKQMRRLRVLRALVRHQRVQIRDLRLLVQVGQSHNLMIKSL